MKKLILIILVIIITGCHSLRYSVRSTISKPVDFGTPSWTADFTEAKKSRGDFYANHTVTLYENTEIDNDGNLHLYSKPYGKVYYFWDKPRYCDWSTGWVDFRDTHQAIYGTWEVKMKLPKKGWPAFWLLRERHSVEETQINCDILPLSKGERIIHLNSITKNKLRVNLWVFYENEFIGYINELGENTIVLDRKLNKDISGSIKIGMDHIVPEVDIMEMFSYGIRNTVHFGYVWDEYVSDGRTAMVLNKSKIDFDKVYSFAVEITPEYYQYYIDGIPSFKTKKGIVNQPLYVILNNARHTSEFIKDLLGDTTEMIVYELNYYEPKN